MTTNKLNAYKVGIRVKCAVCGAIKAPVGRSVPFGSFYCDRNCTGFYLEPGSGCLWPGESEADFGYPVADVGTEMKEAE